jgi:tetratricopeptide (TPR) repeat protein
MRGLWFAILIGSAGIALAEPSVARLGPACQRVSLRVTSAIDANAKAQPLVGRRCERDRWSRDAQACFLAAVTGPEAQRCLDKLSKEQRTAIEGDADRLGDTRLQKWLARRPPIASRGLPPVVTLAVLAEAPGYDLGKVRLLQKQGVTAYQAGHYDLALRKFAGALEHDPKPELVYYSAQAFRLKGDRAAALQHYERYLEIAPRGPAANDCRSHIEKLRDALP